MLLIPIALICTLRENSSELDPAQVAAIVKKAEETHSDAVVIMVDGKIVVDKWFRGIEPRPIDAMSATKSIVNLAIGMLIKDGKIKSVEDRVQQYFPQYKGGGKEKVTIKNLLNHTSGIQAREDTMDIYSSSDFVQNALEKPLISPPGSTFFYNNRAVNLLEGVATKAAGQRMDLYLTRKLFKRLGIWDFVWLQDGAGNPQGMAGFQVRPEDFAKIGNFVMRGCGGLLPQGWIANSTQPSPGSLKEGEPCGWLWWPIMQKSGVCVDDELLTEWKAVGIRPALIQKVVPMKGRIFNGLDDFSAVFRKLFVGDQAGFTEINNYFTSGKARWSNVTYSGPVHSYYADGYLGQYLVIVPEAHLVAVRMRHGINETDEESDKRGFDDFPAMVDKLRRVGSGRSKAR